MKKIISMRMDDEVAIKNLGYLYNILNVYCHGLLREGYIRQGWQISIEDYSIQEKGSYIMMAEVTPVRDGNLPFFEAYKRHSSILGATDQQIINTFRRK